MTKHTVKVSLPIIAKSIDHALLHPSLSDAKIEEGLRVARDLNTATACIKAYSIPHAKRVLEGSSVLICPVIGFPAGNSTTASKVAEAREAAELGGHEIDMVVNVGKVISEDWTYVSDEIRAINDAVTSTGGAILKVIFENDYLEDRHIIKLCEICSEIGVAFVKTSTGFGFVQGNDGKYSYAGATLPHLQLMRKHTAQGIKIKASGGVRTYEAWLKARAAGADRIGTSSIAAILREAKSEGVGEEEIEVSVDLD